MSLHQPCIANGEREDGDMQEREDMQQDRFGALLG